MLGELTGVAITAIEWLPYLNELSHIAGIKEPLSEILSSFKSLHFQTQVNFQTPLKARFVFMGPGNIYGKNLILPKFLKVVNPEVLIMTVTTPSIIDITCYIEQGVGLTNQFEELILNRNHFLLKNRSLLPITTNFNPVIEANYMLQDRVIENLRLRESMQIVIWDITTNGTLKPFEALVKAANLASSIFQDISLSTSLIPEPKIEQTYNTYNSIAKTKIYTSKVIIIPKVIVQRLILIRKNKISRILPTVRKLLRKKCQLIIPRLKS
jgi:DNA-directed RNA polymerase alpha subunit